jgi:hypothetical protein
MFFVSFDFFRFTLIRLSKTEEPRKAVYGPPRAHAIRMLGSPGLPARTLPELFRKQGNCTLLVEKVKVENTSQAAADSHVGTASLQATLPLNL